MSVREGGREGGRSEREITEKSYMHILKMLWLSIELHSNKCLYSLQTYQQASLHWLACLRGLPTSAASNQLRPLVGGPAMVMKPFPDLSKHNLRGGCTRTHTLTHTSQAVSVINMHNNHSVAHIYWLARLHQGPEFSHNYLIDYTIITR